MYLFLEIKVHIAAYAVQHENLKILYRIDATVFRILLCSFM